MCQVSNITCNSQSARARILTFWKKVHLLPHVMCHVSCVMCHMSHVTSLFLFSSLFFFYKVVKLCSCGRVRYQRWPFSPVCFIRRYSFMTPNVLKASKLTVRTISLGLINARTIPMATSGHELWTAFTRFSDSRAFVVGIRDYTHSFNTPTSLLDLLPTNPRILPTASLPKSG